MSSNWLEPEAVRNVFTDTQAFAVSAAPARAAGSLETAKDTSPWALPVYLSHGPRPQEVETPLMLVWCHSQTGEIGDLAAVSVCFG